MKPKTFSHSNLVTKLPSEVKILFKIFGDDIRLVGGCVRDLLLKKKLNDFDFATRFLPEKVMEVLQNNKIKAVPTGIKFGTITAVVNGKNFEITTLRKDSETNGRHCSPEFIDDFFLDAARRDFTINALYLDLEGELSDYFEGISDLKNQKVKFIGDAESRIVEDFLRILRFFRFSCEYAQELDDKGLEACVKQKENLKKLSRERIRAEFLKMLASSRKENLIAILKILKSKKISQQIFSAKLDIEALEALFEIEKEFKFSADLNLKLAVLFYQKNVDLKTFYQEICATNLEKRYFQFFENYAKEAKKIDLKYLKQLLANFDKDLVLDLCLIDLTKNFDSAKILVAKENFKYLQKFSLPDFPLKSSELIDLGFEGKDFGAALQKAKILWADNDFKLQKDELIQRLIKVG